MTGWHVVQELAWANIVAQVGIGPFGPNREGLRYLPPKKKEKKGGIEVSQYCIARPIKWLRLKVKKLIFNLNYWIVKVKNKKIKKKTKSENFVRGEWILQPMLLSQILLHGISHTNSKVFSIYRRGQRFNVQIRLNTQHPTI